MIANMIKANDEAAKAQASAIFEAHAADLKNFQRPSACKSWSTKSSTRKPRSLANNTWILMLRQLMENFKRQLAAALSYTKDKETLEALLKEWKNKDVVKPQDLAMSWYYNFLHDDFTQGRTWTWARENWD